MAETRATIRARVERYVGDSIPATINDAINDAYVEIQRRHNYRFMEESTTISISDGDTTFSLPSDLKEIANPEMSDADGSSYRRMTGILKNGIEARSTADEGRPMLFRIWDATGYLYAQAGEAYTFLLEYYRWLPEITSDAAISGDDQQQAFLDHFRKAIEYYALSAAYGKMQEFEKADWWERKFERQIRQYATDDTLIAIAGVDMSMEVYG